MSPLPSLSAVPDEIDTLTEQFTRTGNRALAWHIYHVCRRAGRAVPVGVMTVVDNFAAGISEVAVAAIESEPGDDTIRFESADLGRLWRSEAGKDPVGALQAEARDVKVFLKLMHEVDRGIPVAAAIDQWAKKRIKGLGKDRLWQIWGAFQRDQSTPGRRTVR